MDAHGFEVPRRGIDHNGLPGSASQMFTAESSHRPRRGPRIRIPPTVHKSARRRVGGVGLQQLDRNDSLSRGSRVPPWW